MKKRGAGIDSRSGVASSAIGGAKDIGALLMVARDGRNCERKAVFRGGSIKLSTEASV